MRPSRLAVLLAAGILASTGRILAAAAALTAPDERPPAPGFSLEGAAGREVILDDYRGEVVILNFWATWCHGCKQEMPWLVQFEKQYGSRGLTVVGASTDADGWKTVRPFLAKKKLNYPVVIADESMTKSYGVVAMPVTVLIDRQGRVAATYQGVIDRAICTQAIQSLLRESASPASPESR